MLRRRRALLAGCAAGALLQACSFRPAAPTPSRITVLSNAPDGTVTPIGYSPPHQASMLATIEAVSAEVTPIPDYALFGSVPAPTRTTARIQRGVNLASWSNGDYLTSGADATLETLAGLGAQWVGIVVTAYQDTTSATTIDWAPARGISIADVVHAITTAHRLGLRVMLKPQVDLASDPTRWRGEIGAGFSEEQRQTWFASYAAGLLHLAALARYHHVEQFCVGTELEGLSGAEARWRDLIRRVRQAYPGTLTYASNHDGEETQVTWWDALDYIGVDAYYSLVDEVTPTVDALRHAWADLGYVQRLQNLHDRFAKPILFTEIGYRSIDSPAYRPLDFTRQAQPNAPAQAHAYQAALEVFSPLNWFAGCYWWSWDPNPASGGPSDDGYTPAGKPAEAVLRRYYHG